MTAIRVVFTATVAVVGVSIALVVVGVGLLAGLPWALIAAGGLLGTASVAGAAVLLRDGGSP